jgi:tRNA dimethylallyltransferase
MLLTILGPTACGKTAVATRLAALFATERDANQVSCGFPAEIISADSRQVFRGMDIGTGKDLADYEVVVQSGDSEELLHIPYHLIDIAEPGTKYSVFHFQRDFMRAYHDICSRGRVPILCGGTGLYIESVLRAYNLVEVPVNPELREQLEGKSLEELTALLATYKRLHNTTDVDTARRAIRAIEIEEYYRQNGLSHTSDTPETPSTLAPPALSVSAGSPGGVPGGVPGGTPAPLPSLTIGLDVPRDLRRERITARLRRRLQEENMTEEVQRLLDEGVPAEALLSYGLEYRYITLHLLGQLTFDEMAHQLEIAIHQFAKRQMTYFRGMERRGVNIHWIDATRPINDLSEEIFRIFLASFEEKQ